MIFNLMMNGKPPKIIMNLKFLMKEWSIIIKRIINTKIATKFESAYASQSNKSKKQSWARVFKEVNHYLNIMNY